MLTHDVVFCRYNESEEDILNVVRNTNCRVFVYDRGNIPLTFLEQDTNRLVHIRDENSGREEAVYFRHIVENYDSLPELIVFSQARNTDSIFHHYDGGFIRWMEQLTTKINYESFVTSSVVCDLSGLPHHGGLPLKYVFSIACPERALPTEISFKPCAIFATSGSAIRKVNRNIYDSLNNMTRDVNYSNLCLPWCMERLWESILNSGESI